LETINDKERQIKALIDEKTVAQRQEREKWLVQKSALEVLPLLFLSYFSHFSDLVCH
jgi:hypothetical protein